MQSFLALSLPELSVNGSMLLAWPILMPLGWRGEMFCLIDQSAVPGTSPDALLGSGQDEKQVVDWERGNGSM